MIIAITGNIGSGKTTVADIFQKAGFKVINVDKIGHELYFRPDVKKKIIRRFSERILTNGDIDRRKLKNIVFNNSKRLIELNKIVHPEIIKEIKKISKQSKKIVIDGALIIEAKFNEYDKLILITADKKTQISRLTMKRKYTRKEIINIINSQLPQEKKISYADYIVDNSGTKKEFEKSIKKIIRELE